MAGLSDEQLAKILNSEEFWEDMESDKEPEMSQNQPSGSKTNVVTVNDQADALRIITEEGDQSNEEDDLELLSEHDTNSEYSISSDDNSDDENIDGETLSQKAWYGKDGTKWGKDPPSTSKVKRENIITFKAGNTGSALATPPENPLFAWLLFITEDILHKIVDCTNKKIESMCIKYKHCKRRRDSRTLFTISFINKTTIKELKAFLGLLYLQSIFKSNHEDIRSMWCTDGTGRDIFRCTMSLPRFAFLLSCLRFDDETTRKNRVSINKLAPISEIFDLFVANCKENYIPGEYLTIDEMLVPFRGRCGFRMYIPNKPAKYGIKVQVLADSKTHYMCNAEVYTGAKPLKPAKNLLPNPTQVVLRLVEYLPVNSNRNITADNWYSAIETVNELRKRNFTYVGTLRKNKRQIPPEFQANRKREISSSIFGFQGGITLVSHVPKQGKSVILISSMHHTNTVNRNTKKPDIIHFYNETKAGVDALDEKCAVYSTSRRTRRWPMALFHSILNIAGVNSRVVYEASPLGKKISRYAFIKQVGLALCEPYMHERLCNQKVPRNLRLLIANILKVKIPIETQCTERIPTSKRKRCFFCPSKSDKKTATLCDTCKKPICTTCAKKKLPRML